MALPKLAVFDVDGTLITFSGSCSDRTRETVQRLRSAGVATAIATGRPRVAVPETIDLVGPVDFAICGNGSSTVDLSTGQVLRESTIPGAAAAHVITSVRARVPGVGFAVEFGVTGIEEPGFERRLPPRRDTIAPVDDVLAELGSPVRDVQRVTAFHDEFDDNIHGLADLVTPLLPSGCGFFIGNELPLVEVIPAGDHKGVAVAGLAAHLGLRSDQVTAFGDGGNDVEMFEWVGCGVAMGPRSNTALLKVADAVTDPVEDDGVANWFAPHLPA